MRQRPERTATHPGAGSREGCPDFPLPLLGEACRPRASGARRRRGEAAAVRGHLNDALRGLNWLEGFGFKGSAPRSPQSSNTFHADVVARLEACIKANRPAADAPSGEAALRELLRGHGAYSSVSDGGNALAPFKQDSVALPSRGDTEGSPFVEEVCPPECLKFLEGNHERMLRCEADRIRIREEEPVQPYTDPDVIRNHRRYIKFIQKLKDMDLVTYVKEPRSRVGLFFVYKKDKRLRLIIDAREANQWFADPPGVAMCSSESLARAELVLPSDFGAVAGELPALDGCHEAYIGICDVESCFHRLRIHSSLSSYFCMPPLTARSAGLIGTSLDGRVLVGDDLVYPA